MFPFIHFYFMLPIDSLISQWRKSNKFHSLSLLEKGLLLHTFYRLGETFDENELSSPSVPDLFFSSFSTETGTPHELVIAAVASLTEKGFFRVRDRLDFRYFYNNP